VRAALVLAMLSMACAGEDDRPAVWSFIAPAIIQPNCATSRCHSKFTATQGLRFDDMDASYTYLVGADEAGPCEDPESPHNFVVPCRPDDSKLMYMLRGEETVRMPPDQPLPDPDIDLIARWILAGAPKD
jgi:hypothetical protein